MNTLINFKLAQLLKEKGYGMNEEGYIQLPTFYDSDSTYYEYEVYVGNKYDPNRGHLGASTINDFEAHLTMMDNSLDGIYLAPTIADVIMWLYDTHRIWVEVNFLPNIDKFSFIAKPMNFKKPKKFGSYKLYYNAVHKFISKERYNTPTEAVEAAIEYVLTKLI